MISTKSQNRIYIKPTHFEDVRITKSVTEPPKKHHIKRRSHDSSLVLPKITNPRQRLLSNLNITTQSYSSLYIDAPLNKTSTSYIHKVSTIDKIIEECDNYDPKNKEILLSEISKSELEIQDVMREIKKLDLPNIKKNRLKLKRKNMNDICLNKKQLKKIIDDLRREIRLGYE